MGAMTAEDFATQLARERALKQAEKMETIGRLTGAIAQQFNELLTAILARTTALAQTVPPNRDLDALKETAQRGAELAQRLLGFSRHRVLDLQPLILTEFVREALEDRKSTRLNSSHDQISYAVFCLKKKQHRA